MTVYSSLNAVSVALYGLLNVVTLTALGVTVCDDIGQSTAFPMLFFEVQEKNLGGMGTKPANKRVLEVDVRLHVYSQHGGMKEAQTILSAAIGLLRDPPPTITGFSSWAIFHDEIIPLGDQLVAGQKVKELVGMARLYVEEA